MESWFHVSSAANRESIRAHGLDWTRMRAAPGIAGSPTPEVDGVFLCADEFEARYFVQMNNTGGPVDVWAVTGIDHQQMTDNGNGYFYFPDRISAAQVTLVEWPSADAAPAQAPARKKKTQKKKTPRTRGGRRT